MGRWVLHVDLDQFLVAAELLRRPELRGLPVVVGGDGDPTRRGVVSTASYEARAFGVGSAVPLRTALKRCPQAVFLPVDKDYYDGVSDEVMTTLRSFGYPVQVLGWDEAFLGVTADDPFAVAEQIRARVLESTGLTCSVGIGDNTLQAKIATGFGKPDGVGALSSETWFDRMGGEPSQALWGVGSRTAARLQELGIRTIRELALADRDTLAKAFGPNTGPWLIAVAHGFGSTEVDPQPWVARGRSKEVTYQHNLTDWAEIEDEVARLAREAMADGAGRAVWRVTVKVRHAPFFTHTKGRKLAEPTFAADVVEQSARELLRAFTDRGPVRLLGVRTDFVMPKGR